MNTKMSRRTFPEWIIFLKNQKSSKVGVPPWVHLVQFHLETRLAPVCPASRDMQGKVILYLTGNTPTHWHKVNCIIVHKLLTARPGRPIPCTQTERRRRRVSYSLTRGTNHSEYQLLLAKLIRKGRQWFSVHSDSSGLLGACLLSFGNELQTTVVVHGRAMEARCAKGSVLFIWEAGRESSGTNSSRIRPTALDKQRISLMVWRSSVTLADREPVTFERTVASVRWIRSAIQWRRAAGGQEPNELPVLRDVPRTCSSYYCSGEVFFFFSPLTSSCRASGLSCNQAQLAKRPRAASRQLQLRAVCLRRTDEAANDAQFALFSNDL